MSKELPKITKVVIIGGGVVVVVSANTIVLATAGFLILEGKSSLVRAVVGSEVNQL